MGRLQDWWTRFWESSYHPKRRAIHPNEAELVVEVEDSDALSAQMEELAQRLRELDWGQATEDGEAADRLRAKLDAICTQPNNWADLLFLATEGDEPSYIEVGHKHSTSWPIPVEAVGASVYDSLTPLYDPTEHKTLEDIREEAQPTAMGLPMALFNGECRWWTTNISDCFMDPLSDAKCPCKRPCCPHCGEPLVMVPLSDFIHRARQYPTSFGDNGLWALELAHAVNLGRRMCLNEWDWYAEVAVSYTAAPGADNDR